MPPFVTPHDPLWKTAFEAEARAITSSLGDRYIALHHIGSTAIPGILAKPIIDLMGIVSDLDDLDLQSKSMESLGYEVMGPYGIDGRRYFRKITPAGQRTHQLHVFTSGSPHIERHLAFRDYLRAHPRVAADYSALKASLTNGHTPTWENYMDGKDPFIATTEKDAVEWFRSQASPM
ncbi:GrpB family protein [Roseibium algae]|uniref:GrpB family protein n=1 Tax=Roseibium algae TaxID=3123038 RepID=A0ABU8TL30_9HYPH